MTDRQKPTDAEIKALKEAATNAIACQFGHIAATRDHFTVSAVDPEIILALLAERERLREALRPFVVPRDASHSGAMKDGDIAYVIHGHEIKVGDFRRARAALEGR